MKNPTKQSKTEAAPASQQVTTENREVRPITFVVVRDGFRVSDKEYVSATDPFALNERNFWKRVATNHSHGEPVTIVQYDSKQHRVW